MGTSYRVDLRALQEAAQGVNGTLDEVTVRAVKDIPHDPSAIGHSGLADVLSDFLDRWERGVDNLVKDGQEIATRLTANVNAYTKTEQGVAGQFEGILRGKNDPGVK